MRCVHGASTAGCGGVVYPKRESSPPAEPGHNDRTSTTVDVSGAAEAAREGRRPRLPAHVAERAYPDRQSMSLSGGHGRVGVSAARDRFSDLVG